MLLVLPGVEARLARTREFMNQLDEAAFHKGTQPIARRIFENKLNYLRTYACGLEEVDESKAVCILSADAYPYCFAFSVYAQQIDESGTQPFLLTPGKGWCDLWKQTHPRHIISGGLIWSGPKDLNSFASSPAMILRPNDWGTHT